jgi:predicted metal-dependent HD superfamily phosphohydrolase
MMRDEMWEEAARVVRGDVRGLFSVREDLERRWSEPHRGYHDLRHLDEVLAALQELRAQSLDTDAEWAAVVFAAWFHDAVYDVTAPADNERLSAELARTTLSHNGVEPGVVAATQTLVEASAAHEVTETSGPQAAFHDADLWILSAPSERFDGYCADVRREYAAVPDDAYAEGRSAILRPFLERETIYRTDHAREHWGAAARDNLARELARIAGPCPS